MLKLPVRVCGITARKQLLWRHVRQAELCHVLGWFFEKDQTQTRGRGGSFYRAGQVKAFCCSYGTRILTCRNASIEFAN